MSIGMTGMWVFLIVVLPGLAGVCAAQLHDIEWGGGYYLRRAAEAYAAGAHGFYMFNAWGRRHVALVRGISDPVFVTNWRRYLDPENLTSEIATDQARQAIRARRQDAAQRQRRLILNNGGDDAASVLKSQPAPPLRVCPRTSTGATPPGPTLKSTC